MLPSALLEPRSRTLGVALLRTLAIARSKGEIVCCHRSQFDSNRAWGCGNPTGRSWRRMRQSLAPVSLTIAIVTSVQVVMLVRWNSARPALRKSHLRTLRHKQDSLPEWSKGVDSSSTSASCVGSNPTAVICPCSQALKATLIFNSNLKVRI